VLKFQKTLKFEGNSSIIQLRVCISAKVEIFLNLASSENITSDMQCVCGDE
jgi:hypothetical protein